MMSAKSTPTDKEVLRRVMSEPTFEKVAERMRHENALRKKAVGDTLRQAALDHEDDEECGRWNDGRLGPSCTLAGTEFCDWECPYSR